MISKIKKILIFIVLIVAILFIAYKADVFDTGNNIQDSDQQLNQTEEVVDDHESQLSINKKVDIDYATLDYGDSYESAIEVIKEYLPVYQGNAYIEINGNNPFFTKEQKKNTEEFEIYSGLDNLGRCGVAYANVSPATLPEGERTEDMSEIRPTGYQVVRYEDLIDNGGFLYNRCHLIAFCLAGEEVNKYNLITGTRSMNLAMEDAIETNLVKYVEMTDRHVQYRVTPIFMNDELVARGVLVEAYSVENKGITFNHCLYFFNNQPGITIDYATGDSTRE